MTAPVYILESLGDPAKGSILVLDGPEGRHAATVRRARVGEHIDVVNGTGTRALCTVVDVRKDEVHLDVTRLVAEPEPSPRITLVQALAKGGRDEQAVETSTEYGVFRVIPWESDRCVVRWKGKEAKGRAKWQATAVAAAKQSRRSWIPRVEDVHTTRSLVARIREESATVYVCHEEATQLLVDVISNESEAAASSNVWILVGPEGGISPEEIEAMREAGGIPVLLAPHVLRSASAGPYAIATIAARVGSTR